jgi:hypothetical protein
MQVKLVSTVNRHMVKIVLGVVAVVVVTTWLLGDPADSRLQPTFGPIEHDGVDDEGLLDMERAPDFITVLDRSGDIAGYVRASDLARLEQGLDDDEVLEVFDTDLNLVGRMVPNRGFVPVGEPFDAVPPLDLEYFHEPAVETQP